MPLLATSDLPAFASLKDEGVDVVSPDQASTELPFLSVGLLNLMPDSALRATDRQFIRLASAVASQTNLVVVPFTVAAEARGSEARAYVDSFYSSFGAVKSQGLDALIISGANPAQPNLADESFWPGLLAVIDWAEAETSGVVCSCLATHAVLQHRESLTRMRLPEKRWGVYSHQVVADHPLVRGVPSPVVTPHSRWYDLPRRHLEDVGVRVLVESEEAGVHLAVSADEFYVFFQGHPEYESVSLLKEYQREVDRFVSGERDQLPPYPDHYFSDAAIERLEAHRAKATAAKRFRASTPELDEFGLVEASMWTPSGQTLFANWLSRLLVS